MLAFGFRQETCNGVNPFEFLAPTSALGAPESTAEVAARYWGVVCGMHSIFYRHIADIEARHQMTPPAQKIDGVGWRQQDALKSACERYMHLWHTMHICTRGETRG